MTVNPAAAGALAAFTLNPTVVVGGNPSTGTVTLTAPAPPGGALVTLTSSSSSRAAVPANVVVAAGTTAKSFTVTTTPVKRDSGVTLSASYAGVKKTSKLTVKRR